MLLIKPRVGSAVKNLKKVQLNYILKIKTLFVKKVKRFSGIKKLKCVKMVIYINKIHLQT